MGFASGGSTISSISRVKHFTWILKPKRKRMLWNDTTGTSFQKNQIYILMAKSTGGYTVTPDINAQTCFIDS